MILPNYPGFAGFVRTEKGITAIKVIISFSSRPRLTRPSFSGAGRACPSVKREGKAYDSQTSDHAQNQDLDHRFVPTG